MAFYNLKNGATSVILRTFLRSSQTSYDSALTGLTFNSSGLIISVISDVESSAVSYAQATGNIQTITSLGTYSSPLAARCRFREVDSTNHPGLYEIQLDDSRFSVTGAKSLTITISGATNLVTENIFIQLVEVPSDVTKWLGTAAATPNVAGVPITDVGYVAGVGATPSATPDVNVASIDSDVNLAGSIGSLAAQAKTDVAAAVLDQAIDGSYTLTQLTRLIASALLAKVSGAEGTTVTFRDISDTKNRIIAVVDADGNRATLTFNVS